MAKKPLNALLPVLLLPALALIGASPAGADPTPGLHDTVTITSGATQILGGAATSGGVAVNDDVLLQTANKVSGQATLADGSAVTVNLKGAPALSGDIRATRGSTKISVHISGDVTRVSDDTITWSGPAVVGSSIRTIKITITDGLPDPGDHLVRMVHHGQNRVAFVRVPPKRIAPVTPVLYHFPGLLESAYAAETFQHPATAADKYGYVLVTPEHYGIGWQGVPAGQPGEDVDDPGYIRALNSVVQTRFGGDPKRTYASGMSNGGFFTSYAACVLPDLFAAYAPVSGQLTDAGCNPGHPVPVLMIHGDADPIVPYASTGVALPLWLKINRCGTAETTELLPDRDPTDGTRVLLHRYTGCPASAPVLLYQVEGGGHAWPGGTPYPIDLGKDTQDIDANAVIWTFVKQFAL